MDEVEVEDENEGGSETNIDCGFHSFMGAFVHLFGRIQYDTSHLVRSGRPLKYEN